jgi:hypothetical protein
MATRIAASQVRCCSHNGIKSDITLCPFCAGSFVPAMDSCNTANRICNRQPFDRAATSLREFELVVIQALNKLWPKSELNRPSSGHALKTGSCIQGTVYLRQISYHADGI